MAQQKPVVKKTTNKYKTLGGETGNPPFDKNSPVTYLPGRKATNVPSTQKAKPKKMMKAGGAIKAKNGKSFPDLNKDGKITKADILKGRGVIAQKGATVKKKTGMDAVKAVGKYVSTFGGATERDNPKQKDINIVKKLKETGNKVKNKLGLKSGGSVKKCKYGCK